MIGDIELFCRERRRLAPHSPFVAITGTNGKSTTTALIAHHLLNRPAATPQLGGNIGTAVLTLEPPRADRAHVIECSSYQIDLAPSLDPRVGILINVSEDHLDRHGTHRALRRGQGAAGRGRAARRRGGDRRRRRMVRAPRPTASRAKRQERGPHLGAQARCPTASTSKTARSCGRRPAGREADRQHSTASARCAALHNAQNACCAAARRWRSASTPRTIQTGLRSFPGLAHRMEQVGRKGAVLFVNDSKATNADSAAQALACFTDIFWIAGGKPKTGGITSLAGFFPRIRKAYLIGEAAAEFARTLDGKVAYEMAGTLDRAVAAVGARRGGVRAQGAGGAAVAGLRLVRPVSAISRCAATAFRDLVLALPGINAGLRRNRH